MQPFKHALFTIQVPTSSKTHCIAITKTNQTMQYRKMTAVCSENYTKDINTGCEQNVHTTLHQAVHRTTAILRVNNVNTT
jgi:hypothetical protein